MNTPVVNFKRHLAKAFTYRILGSLQTSLISYYFTGNLWVSGGIASVELVIKPVMYFLHERVWYTFSGYGVKSKENKKE